MGYRKRVRRSGPVAGRVIPGCEVFLMARGRYGTVSAASSDDFVPDIPGSPTRRGLAADPYSLRGTGPDPGRCVGVAGRVN
jgi:hypothetical protein